MRTVVIQSTKKFDTIPKTTAVCLGSTKVAADANGFDYAYVNDELFDQAETLKNRLLGFRSKLPLTDYCRNKWSLKLLAKYDRVIWVDADIYIKDPKVLDIGSSWALSAERWMRIENGMVQGSSRVGSNNSIQCYTETSIDVLEMWIKAQEIGAKAYTSESHDMIGTRLFKALMPVFEIPHVQNHIIVDQNVMLQYSPKIKEGIMEAYKFKDIMSANLCYSEVGTAANPQKIVFTDQMYIDFIQKL